MSTSPAGGEGHQPSLQPPFLAGFERFPGILSHPPRILDTAHVLNELKDHVRRGYPVGGVVASSISGRGPLVAPGHVYTEIYGDDGWGHADKFEKLAGQSVSEEWPTDAAEFRRVFERDYLPRIRFVPVGDEQFEGDPVVQSVGSRKDIGTARLAVLLACDSPIVFSPDTHLHRPGLAPKNHGPVIQATATMEVAELSVYATGYVSLAGAQRLHRGIKRASDSVGVPPLVGWAAVAVLAGAIILFALRTPERREATAKLLSPVGGLYIEIGQSGQRSRAELAAYAIPLPESPTLAQRIAHELLRSNGSLSESAIVATLGSQTVTADAIHDELINTPSFVQHGDGRWELGRVLGRPIAG